MKENKSVYFKYLLMSCVLSAAFFVPRVFLTDSFVEAWDVAFCDVGQGDGAVVQTSTNHALVIDVGASSKKMSDCLHDLDILVIDLLVLSHFHADHAGATSSVVTDFTVKEVLISPLLEPNVFAKELVALLQTNKIPVSTASVGQQNALGNVFWQVLWPAADFMGLDKSFLTANNSSVTMLVRIGKKDLVFLGDLENESQKKLLDSLLVGDQQFVDSKSLGGSLVKVAHHGSAKQVAQLYEYLAPEVAVISVGADNSYGHPTAKLLDMLKGVPVFRTDQQGRILVKVVGEKFEVSTQR